MEQKNIEYLYDLEQNSDEWFDKRSGLVTASSMSKVLAKGGGKTRATYMKNMVAEQLSGKALDNKWKGNKYTERGHEFEPEIVALYEAMQGVEVKQCGLIINHDLKIACSPDGIVGEDGGSEFKTRNADIHIDLLQNRKIPNDAILQCQASMLVTGRQWWDYYSYFPNLPTFIERIEPDLYLHAQMKDEVNSFYMDLEALKATLIAMY